METTGYIVRHKGHWCALVKTGYAYKPVLLRARKGEARYEAVVEERTPNGDEVWGDNRAKIEAGLAKLEARLACARLIRRTEEVRRRIERKMGESTLALESLWANPVVSRIRAMDRLKGAGRPGGKIWKICPVTEGDKKALAKAEEKVNVPASPAV